MRTALTRWLGCAGLTAAPTRTPGAGSAWKTFPRVSKSEHLAERAIKLRMVQTSSSAPAYESGFNRWLKYIRVSISKAVYMITRTWFWIFVFYAPWQRRDGIWPVSSVNTRGHPRKRHLRSADGEFPLFLYKVQTLLKRP